MGVYVHVAAQRSALGVVPQELPSLFEKWFLTDLELTSESRPASRLTSGPFIFVFPTLGLQEYAALFGLFLCGVWGQNSGFCVWVTSALSTEPFPQP